MSKEKKEKKPTTPKKMFFKRFFLTLLIAVVVMTSGMFAYGTFMNSQIMDKSDSTVTAATKKDAVMKDANDLDVLFPGSGIFTSDYAESKRINILMMGNTEEELTDTIMLLSLDPESKSADIISIPRDTYYEREGFSGSYLKVNSVAHEGPKAMCEAVHNILLGIPINYYFLIDYDGVKNIVNSMGGVPMDVPQDMYYVSARQDLVIDLQAGQQTLDGDKAIQFLRYRKGYINGDLGRVQAQQEFIKSAAKEAMGLSLPVVAKTVVDNVDSLITPKAITFIVKQVTNVDFKNLRTHTIPGTDGYIGALSFFTRSDDTEIEKLIRAVYDGTAYPPEEETTDDVSGDGEEGAE